MQANYKPSLPQTLDRAALLKLRTIFSEDPHAYSRELNIIAEALDGAEPIYPCDDIKMVPREPIINQTIPL